MRLSSLRLNEGLVRHLFLSESTTPPKDLKIISIRKLIFFVVIESHNPHIFNEFYLKYKLIHEKLHLIILK